MRNAEEMLQVARENLNNNHISSACNRAYYAIFYAASALLYSKGKSYGKHSAVLAAFRQYFIKTGEFDKKWSDDYEFMTTTNLSWTAGIREITRWMTRWIGKT